MNKKRLKGVSLFASAGIGETYFKNIGIDIVVANELIERRANLYKAISPETDVICGDITDKNIFNKISIFFIIYLDNYNHLVVKLVLSVQTNADVAELADAQDLKSCET